VGTDPFPVGAVALEQLVQEGLGLRALGTRVVLPVLRKGRQAAVDFLSGERHVLVLEGGLGAGDGEEGALAHATGSIGQLGLCSLHRLDEMWLGVGSTKRGGAALGPASGLFDVEHRYIDLAEISFIVNTVTDGITPRGWS